ncbi:Periplasmic pH-dependent serine endoprotease DegQ [Xanthomonas hydrangeae]|uniref:DegQ family serine endoprotease n=1 Tax=Xanthomonas hydrangeae TaxID=2775159 RepID=UPI0019633513|nr:Periplasmic pH-dependent serine endoprotease DegQ [Xanthomonas hydrangeae]CAD7719649.1 Periplasmic pH-dependent serine endoprotease DegQ [Xanthomonas hydrangeae]CAD7736970.1 Periplasmic pH-dependent serine endoprotease DegQ [Xanthomonas hydrangeae]CAD7736973.1 Periplasmic pH-dependent serine endoprotease DegQ [Xanthomonas hydrangeae]CAD7739555.1 Periplasmic pH-dependent serine endoprotease DegQ [Xanthomonas hydrangeae]
MNHRIRTQMFGLIAMTLPLAACAQQPAPAAKDAAPIAANRSATPAPQLVAGLPDFTNLVEQVGPGVVNIETTITRKDAMARQRRGGPGGQDGGAMPGDEQMPEFFRRFFGPDFQMPGGPRQGPGGPGQGDDDGGIAGKSMGSGFIISADGYVLTNHHVVDGASEVTVKLTDRREFKAKVVGSDEQFDVALLKIEAKGLPTVRLGDSNSLKPGQWVVAIGSPFGLDHSVTAGIVSATGRSNPYADQRYVPFIQTDVAINQGNSGGPLLNTRGEVVGINSQIFSASGGYMGISFAIPIDLAFSAAEQIKSTGHVSRGMLGVAVGPIDSLKAQGLGLPDTRGALVNDIPPGSPAAKAGIEVGDVIRAVNGKPIDVASDLPPMIGLMAPGTKVNLDVLRDGKPRKVAVTLTTLDNPAGNAAPRTAADDTKPSAPASVELLGLQVADLTAIERSRLGLEAGEGVRIASVTGAAARSTQPPLSPGLIIARVGRTKVGSVADINRALASVKKGDVVMLLVTDGKATSYVALKAGG